MRWVRRLGIVVLSVALLGGCRKPADTQPPAAPGEGQTHEALVEGAVASMRHAASSLNRVTDAASAERAAKVLRRETQNLQALRRQLAKLGSASRAERDRVQQHSQDMIAASEEMKQAVAAVVGKIQAGRFPPDVAERLRAACHDYGNAMVDFGKQATPLFE
jgi:hypothetical protein